MKLPFKIEMRFFISLLLAVLLSGGAFWYEHSSDPFADEEVILNENDLERLYVTNSRTKFENKLKSDWKNSLETGEIPDGSPDKPFYIAKYEGEKFDLWDAGVGLKLGSRNNVFWLDNKTVIFAGINLLPILFYENDKIRSFDFTWIYIWELGKGIRKIFPENGVYDSCFSDGHLFIEYAPVRNSITGVIDTRFIKGELDQKSKTVKEWKLYFKTEIASKTRALSAWDPDSRFDYKKHYKSDFGCHYEKRPEYKDIFPEDPANFHREVGFYPLKSGHGFLNSGPFKSKFMPKKEKAAIKVWLHNPEKRLKVKTEIPFQEISLTTTLYAPHKQAYLLSNYFNFMNSHTRKIWKDSKCLPAWWLYPGDGRTEKICIPPGPYSWNGAWNMVPVRDHLLINSANWKSYGDVHKAGFFTVSKNGEIEHILPGVLEVKNSNVSPDGCKIAFEYAPNLAARSRKSGPISIRVLDLCPEKAE